MLVASRRVPVPSGEEWDGAAQALVNAILGDPLADEDLGSLQLGVDLSLCLTHAIWRFPDRFIDPGTVGFWRNRLRDQLSITLGASALAMSYYEVRNVERGIERGDEPDSESMRTAALWAICFFRIAAVALSRYCRAPSHGAPRIDMTQLIARWEGTVTGLGTS